MLAPLSWLCDYAPLGDVPVDTLSATLSDLGLVVEGVEHVGADLPGVVVARILDIRAHPDADRIRLVDVDAGDGQPLQIACGAWNMEVGDDVPLAQIGAVLPGGLEIARRKMRGEWSNGMLCSPTEIGLAHIEGVDGLFILPATSGAPGTPIAEALGGADIVFDLDVAPNRPDALCMAGVARDLAAAFGRPWSLPAATPAGADAARPVHDPSLPRPAVEVVDVDRCPRFHATVIAGVAVTPSPLWLSRRLTLAGLRSINNVVDASNYVMLDVGQPNHAYDRRRLGGGGILVRLAGDGETVVTLDGVARTMTGDDLLICDSSDRPVGVAGVMGGADSEIADDTDEVLLEAAVFDALSVGRTGLRLGLFSEARQRFERGVDPEIADGAAARFAALLAAATPEHQIRVGPSVDERAVTGDQPSIVLRPARLNAVLGTELSTDAIAGHLRSIGFGVGVGPVGDGSALEVTVPSWRPDTSREIDLIEEVARLHGYRNIARTVPTSPGRGGLSPYQRERRQVREILAGAGLHEAWTTTFLAPGDLQAAGLPAAAVTVTNPLDTSESVLRTSLLPGLLKAVRFNADRQQPDVRLFEIGRVFVPPAPGATPAVPLEREWVAGIVAGAGADARVAVRLWAVLAQALRLDGADQLTLAGTPPAALVPAGGAGGDDESEAAGPLAVGEVLGGAGMHPTRTIRLLGRGPLLGRGLSEPDDRPGDPVLLGVAGEVDPAVSAAYGIEGRVAYLQIDLGALHAEPRHSLLARPISRYPASEIDLAFVVDEHVTAGVVGATLRSSGDEALESVRLFDVFRGEQLGEGRKSLAYRLRFRSHERTLDDAELAVRRQHAIDAVRTAHRAELRA